jgi:rRNA maturation endonuclease Nob1
MYSEILTVIKSMEVFLEILKAAKSLSNYNEFITTIAEVNEKLLRFLTAAVASAENELALNNRVRALEQQIMEHENWERTAKDYTLQNVGSNNFAYIYKPPMQSNQPRHWACAKCFQERKLYMLQFQRPPAYICPNCGNKIHPRKKGNLVHINEVYD